MGGFSTAFGAGFAHDPAPTPAPTQPTDEGPAPPAAPLGVPPLCDSNLLLTGIRVLREANKTGAVAVYAAIVVRCSDSGACWPRQATLAADVGVCVRTVKNSIRQCVDAGLLTVQRRAANRSSVYRLTQDVGFELRLVPPVPPVDNLSPRGKGLHHPGAKGCPSY